MSCSYQDCWLRRSRSCTGYHVSAFLHQWWLSSLRFRFCCRFLKSSLIDLHSSFSRLSLIFGFFRFGFFFGGCWVWFFCGIFGVSSLNFSNINLLSGILLHLRLSLIRFLCFLWLFFLLFFCVLLGAICLGLNSRLSVLWLLLWFLTRHDNFDLSLSIGTVLGCNRLLFLQNLDLLFLLLWLWSIFSFLLSRLISDLIGVILISLQIWLNILEDVILRNLGSAIINLYGGVSFWRSFLIIMDLNKGEISLSNTLWRLFFLISLHNHFFSIFFSLFIRFLLF